MTPPRLQQLDARQLPAPLLVAALPGGLVRIGTTDVTPFPGYAGPVDVATDGDRVYVGGGPGGGPRVATFDAAGNRVAPDFFAFEESYRGGVQLAAGGGRLYVAPLAGGAPVVAVFDGPAELQRIFVGDPASRAGVEDLAAFAAPNDVPIVTGSPAGTGTVFIDFEERTPRGYQAEVLDGLAELFAPVGWLRFTNGRPAGVRAGSYGTILVSSGPFQGYEKSAAGYQADDWLSAVANPYQQRTNFVRPSPSAANLYRTIAHELGHALRLNHTEDPAEVMSPYTSSGKYRFNAFQIGRMRDAEPLWLGGQ